jgi:hypothetical protein
MQIVVNGTIFVIHFTAIVNEYDYFYFGHSQYSPIVAIAGVKIVLFIYYGDRHNSTMFFSVVIVL